MSTDADANASDQMNQPVDSSDDVLHVVICGADADVPAASALHDRLCRSGVSADAAPWESPATSRGRAQSQRPRYRFVLPSSGHGSATQALFSECGKADAAIVLVDAGRGLLMPHQRLIHLISLFRPHHAIIAVDGMEQVGYERETFDRVRAEYLNLAAMMGLGHVPVVPISTSDDDNIDQTSQNMPWHADSCLLGRMDALIASTRTESHGAFRMPLDSVHKGGDGEVQLLGWVAGGSVREGDLVRVLPSGRESTVTKILSSGGRVVNADVGDAVAVVLADEVDASSGDIVCGGSTPAQVADQFEATIVWTGAEPMLRSRRYVMRMGSMNVNATVMPLKYRINAATLERLAAERLEREEAGVAELELERPIAYDAYKENRSTGGFVLLDSQSGGPVAVGMLHFALRRATNIHRQPVEINRAARQRLNGHRSLVVWLTGLSGSGKSTLGNLLEARLNAQGVRTYLLDGDNVRHGLNKDLGFTAEDRVENIRRAAEVARLMVDAGIVVITAFISPFRAERQMARQLMEPGEFLEIYVEAPLEVAEARDPKGLYKKARSGLLKNFTGIDSPYEPPERPEAVINTANCNPVEATEALFSQVWSAIAPVTKASELRDLKP